MNALFAPRPHRLRSPIGFIVVALIFFAIDGAIARSPIFLEQPDLFTGAISFDLTLGVTLAYWLMVVRRGGGSARSMIPVFVASVAAAALTLPPGHRDFVRYARYLAVPFELAIVVGIFVAVRGAQRRLAATGTELDVPENIRHVLTSSLLAPRVADIIASEASMFYYALASWRRAPFVPAGARGFSYHKKNGYAGLLYAIAGAAFVELLVVDLVVRSRAPHVANGLLVLGAFGFVWMLGFGRAVQLRPVLVARGDISIRNGLRYRLDVPREQIASVEYGRGAFPPSSTPGYLRGAMGSPNVTIVLREPLPAHGPYGITKLVTRVGLVLDDLSGFQRALEHEYSK
jgi:hypothetical protein